MISYGNHVNFASRASSCFPSAKKQKLDSIIFLFLSMYNKTIIAWSFCGIQNNQGLGMGYQSQPSASNLIILDITKKLIQ